MAHENWPMKSEESNFVEVAQLRVGLYIELDVGWMAHPFPTSSFKISSTKQIETIRGLGLGRVRYVPEKSDPVGDGVPTAEDARAEGSSDTVTTPVGAQPGRDRRDQQLRQQHAEQLAAQQRSLVVCERRFGEANRLYKKTLELLHTQPKAAAQQCTAMVDGFVAEMLTEAESAIRLLSEAAGDKASMHPVNVTIVSLLLGKAMGLTQDDLVDLGLAAFLHDVGKSLLPDRVRWLEDNFSTSEYKLYQEHVANSVLLAKGMGLNNAVQLSIAQHHELTDGSGYPARLRGQAMSASARVLALVNRYDNLCNPARVAAAMTPHEALSMIFAQQKTRFDGLALSAFIRMVGVYPPGSVVQLMDERYALVVSVNSARPLKPRIIVHDPGVLRHEALIMDLEREYNVGIRRSVKPASLPSAAMEFLSPRPRINYFFEAISEPSQPAALT
jgi:HD-GYP domain-containing protein (c-di-GMP phosphodiesterase class II)